ncbi:MAG TPA: glycerophosphodiester phosphodiesterase family protein [Chryseosolibacter sp.]
MNCAQENANKTSIDHFPDFYKEGHRGTRGLMPENTISSMKKAIEDGANFVELDIQVSQDKKVMVAHDPHINRQISLLPNGEEIPEQDARKYILHQMPYDSIRKFDVGSKYHPDFPQQKKIKTYIPLFGELIDSVEQFTKENGHAPVIYNIEVKARPDKDGVFQPVPSELIDLVMEVVKSKDIGNRYYVQSFDIRQIQEVHNRYPGVATGFLTGNKELSLEENLKNIGFTPDIYSPQYQLATKELIEKCHQQGMKFVPWTVNTLEDMKELKSMGVDGIITDYPNLFAELE